MLANILIDSSLVVPWSLDLVQNEPFEYPFKAEYRLSNKQLIYLAALHSSELHSPTFKIIRECLENQKINMMLLEGFRYSLGVSPAGIVKWAVQQEQSGIYSGFETAHAVSLASKRNIPFKGSEPDDSVIYSEASKQGFTSEDLLFYYFVQQCFQMNEARSQFDGQTMFKEIIDSKSRAFEISTKPNYSQFKDWYLKRNGQEFLPSIIDENVPAPYENGTLYTQKISSFICKCRDRFIVKAIESSLNSHDTVLVVCGGSHWSTQRIALQQSLGTPTFSKTN